MPGKKTAKKYLIQANKFYKSILNKNPQIAVLGLNPHCETISKISEEKNEIVPAIKSVSYTHLTLPTKRIV